LKTIYDLISIGIFAGLAILFLQRSASPIQDPIPIWKYALPAVGLALADFLGNHDQAIFSIAVFLAVTGYALTVLKPFRREPPS
jgi:hypothetical protein